MGKKLIIKGADFSENGIIPEWNVLPLSAGSFNTTYGTLMTSSIKFRNAKLVKLGVGQSITFIGIGNEIDTDNYVPGYQVIAYSDDIINSTAEEQKSAALMDTRITKNPSSTGVTYDDIVFTNNKDIDVYVLVAFGYVTATQPSEFNVDALREKYEGKILYKIQ